MLTLWQGRYRPLINQPTEKLQVYIEGLTNAMSQLAVLAPTMDPQDYLAGSIISVKVVFVALLMDCSLHWHLVVRMPFVFQSTRLAIREDHFVQA